MVRNLCCGMIAQGSARANGGGSPISAAGSIGLEFPMHQRSLGAARFGSIRSWGIQARDPRAKTKPPLPARQQRVTTVKDQGHAFRERSPHHIGRVMQCRTGEKEHIKVQGADFQVEVWIELHRSHRIHGGGWETGQRDPLRRCYRGAHGNVNGYTLTLPKGTS